MSDTTPDDAYPSGGRDEPPYPGDVRADDLDGNGLPDDLVAELGADSLATDALPLEEMHRAAVWGRGMCRAALAIAKVPYEDDHDEGQTQG